MWGLNPWDIVSAWHNISLQCSVLEGTSLDSSFWPKNLSLVHAAVQNFKVVSILTQKLLNHASSDGVFWFVLGLLEVNRRAGTRKACLSATRPGGSECKQCRAAEGTCIMSEYFSPQLQTNIGRPSVIGCCISAHLWKVHRPRLKGLGEIGAALPKPSLTTSKSPVWPGHPVCIWTFQKAGSSGVNWARSIRGISNRDPEPCSQTQKKQQGTGLHPENEIDIINGIQIKAKNDAQEPCIKIFSAVGAFMRKLRWKLEAKRRDCQVLT